MGPHSRASGVDRSTLLKLAHRETQVKTLSGDSAKAYALGSMLVYHTEIGLVIFLALRASQMAESR